MNTLTQQISKLHELSGMLRFELVLLERLKKERQAMNKWQIFEPSKLEAKTARRVTLFTYAIELLYKEMTSGKNEVAMNVLLNGYDKILMN